MKNIRLSTNFNGIGPQLERYRSFLRNVVLESSPLTVDELGPKPGVLQKVVYRLSHSVIPVCSLGTNFSPGSSRCVDVIIRGGAGIHHWRDITFQLSRYQTLSGDVISQSLGSPFFVDVVGNPDHTMEWKADKEKYMDLRDAIQHGFSSAKAETLMLHFRRRMLWLRALLVPCDDARLRMEYYFQNALSAELAKTAVPHDPKEWEAYCHLSLCENKECTFFTKLWDNILLQTSVSTWMKLFKRHEDLFREWSILPR